MLNLLGKIMGEKMNYYTSDFDRSFGLCLTIMDRDRRNIRSGFDAKAEVLDRIDSDLPLRRMTDWTHYEKYLYGSRVGNIRQREVIARQLEGRA